MECYSTPAILLRRIEYGDHDLILTFYSLTQGKITLMAKSAKKSQRRFGGILDFFFLLNIVYTQKKTRLPLLTEISLIESFDQIRSVIAKTAYAGYWLEVIAECTEEGTTDPQMFALMVDMLRELNSSRMAEELLNIVFQMRFTSLSGIGPNLTSCVNCHTSFVKIAGYRLAAAIASGGFLCPQCVSNCHEIYYLEKGTIMQLNWVNTDNMEKIRRIRCTRSSLKAGTEFLEAFINHHCHSRLKSLGFLKSIRDEH